MTHREQSSINKINYLDPPIDEDSIGPQSSECTRSIACSANGEVRAVGNGAL